MSFSRRHLWIIALYAGFAACRLVAQTTDTSTSSVTDGTANSTSASGTMVVVSSGSLQLSGASVINVGSFVFDPALSGVTVVSNTSFATSAQTLNSSSASTYVGTVSTGAIPNTGSLNFIDYTSSGGRLTSLASGAIDLTSSNTLTLAAGNLFILPINGIFATQTANSLLGERRDPRLGWASP